MSRGGSSSAPTGGDIQGGVVNGGWVDGLFAPSSDGGLAILYLPGYFSDFFPRLSLIPVVGGILHAHIACQK